MSLRTPLARVLGLGSARDGTGHWLTQRVTAVALLLLGGWFLVTLAGIGRFDHASVLSWAGQPLRAVLLILLSVTLAWHSQLGLQVVIEDYVHRPLLKVACLVANRFVHVLIAVAMVFAVLRIALGAPA